MNFLFSQHWSGGTFSVSRINEGMQTKHSNSVLPTIEGIRLLHYYPMRASLRSLRREAFYTQTSELHRVCTLQLCSAEEAEMKFYFYTAS